jgi:epoxyqueuosine reductase
MKAAIRKRAAELGFDDCRFTTADPPESAPQYEHWLARGDHGEMAYMRRNAHKRANPQHVLAGARTIITLAASYAQDSSESDSLQRDSASLTPLPGVIARYARYEDYHYVLGEGLKSLVEFLNQSGGPSTRSLWYVDTGPLLERDLAQRSGLGFVGKHTNLISRKLGNWLFLAEILTTIDIEPDGPEVNRCGSCSRCIAACPTKAITAPFRLDARRCISYLTIEMKGPIPIEFRHAIGNRIYGCDDCLAVCPWNRFAQRGRLMNQHARRDLATPDLLELLALDRIEFKKRFARTPILRTKRKGFLRNVCVALGNVGDLSALPALEEASKDPEPLIAEHASWAIEQIKGRNKKGRPSLKAAENLLAIQ